MGAHRLLPVAAGRDQPPRVRAVIRGAGGRGRRALHSLYFNALQPPVSVGNGGAGIPPDPFANGQCTYYAYERGPAQDFGKHADADVRGADFSGAPTQARRWKHSSPSVSGAPVASA